MREFFFDDKRVDIAFIRMTEAHAAGEAIAAHEEAFTAGRNAVNLLLRLCYYLSEPVDIESTRGSFHAMARGTYLQVPLTILTIFDLATKAYYLESAVLIRQIIERWVQLRYFARHQDKLMPHTKATRSKDRVSFKTMFEEAAPGSYNYCYSLMSKFAHAGLGVGFFREEHKTPAEGRVIHGSEYNKMFFEHSVNQTLVFAYAYLRGVSAFFPTIRERLDSETSRALDEFVSEFSRVWHGNQRSPENEDSFRRVLLPLIEVVVPPDSPAPRL